MSNPQYIYSWINFHFLDIQQGCINDNLFAASDKTDNIFVWEQNKKKAHAISMIISPIKIIDLKWVLNTNNLAIINQDTCIIWNVYKNISIRRISIKHKIKAIVAERDALFIIHLNNKITKIEGKKSTSFDFHSTWLNNGKLFFRNSEGDYMGDVWEEEEYVFPGSMSNVKRKFEKQNKISINYNIVTIAPNEKVPDLRVPEGFKKFFRGIDFLIIHITNYNIIYQSKDWTIITNRKRKRIGTLILESPAIIKHTKKISYIQCAVKDIVSLTNILRKKVVYHILHNIPIFDNAPDYIFKYRSKPEYTHLSKEKGFVVFVNDDNYEVIDLFANESLFLKGSTAKKHSRILVEEEKAYLLEWNFGNAPPRGHLLLRRFQGTSKTIYNNFGGKKISTNEFLNSDIDHIQSDLVVPKWHKAKMNLVYNRNIIGEQILSLSQIYFLIDKISRSENAAKIVYQDSNVQNFISYGDLDIEKSRFHGIYPLWCDDETCIITISVDRNCYVWEKGKDIPIHSFEVGIPAVLEMSGTIFAMISFNCKETIFYQRNGSALKAFHPHAILTVYDKSKRMHYSKTILYPTHLRKPVLSIFIDGKGVEFRIPSYIDIKESMIFTFLNGKFARINPSKYKRYWNTKSTNTKINQVKSGDEFIIDPHPEIRRELHFRPFIIYDYELVRREDDLTIVKAMDTKIQDQVSSNKAFADKSIFALKLPYSRNRIINTYIPNRDRINSDRIVLLDKVENTPRSIRHTRRELDNRRGRVLIDRMVKEKIRYNHHGIIFHKP